MIENSFYIKESRLDELKLFIKNHLPSTRFKQNPCLFSSEWFIVLSMDVDDANKLSELTNKWYDIDHTNNVKKSLFRRIIDFIY